MCGRKFAVSTMAAVIQAMEGGVPVASAAIMERGAAKSVLQRMEELQELRDKGFISEAEYSEKRGQILSDA